MPIKQIRKGMRKHSREERVLTKVLEELTMSEMYERFMWEKQSEGLAIRTIEEYYIHFQYLMDYLEGDLTSEEMKTVLIEIPYIVVPVETRVLQSGDFRIRGKKEEEIALEFWGQIQRSYFLELQIEKVICDGKDIIELVKNLK